MTFLFQPVTDPGALAALEEEWWALWRRSPGATPFTAPAWALPWWTSFAPGALRSLALRRDGQLVALAAYYLEDGDLGRRLLPLGIGISDHMDVLLDPACEGAAEALAEAFAETWDDWDVWELEELGPGAAGLALPPPPGCGEEGGEGSACPHLPLGKGPGDMPAAVPPRWRRNVERARRLCEKRGSVAIESVTDAGAFLDALFRLHGARWQSRGEGGVLRDERLASFHAAALPQLLAAGLARLYTLRIGGAAVAASYGLSHAGVASAYLSGFDPDYAHESPGAVLMGHAISEAFREGAAVFDFLRGRERYKYHWGAADRVNRRRSFRRSPA